MVGCQGNSLFRALTGRRMGDSADHVPLLSSAFMWLSCGLEDLGSSIWSPITQLLTHGCLTLNLWLCLCCVKLTSPDVLNRGCTKPRIEPGPLRLKVAPNYQESWIDSTQVRTQVTQTRGTETITNQQLVWSRFQPRSPEPKTQLLKNRDRTECKSSGSNLCLLDEQQRFNY